MSSKLIAVSLVIVSAIAFKACSQSGESKVDGDANGSLKQEKSVSSSKAVPVNVVNPKVSSPKARQNLQQSLLKEKPSLKTSLHNNEVKPRRSKEELQKILDERKNQR